MYFHYFIIRVKKGWALYSNKLEYQLPKDAWYQVWVIKLFWGRRFFNFVNVFSRFPYYLALEKGVTLYIN